MLRAAAAVALAVAFSLAPGLASAEIYFGSLHGHTGYSDGQGSPKQVFAWARQFFDFYAVTDHGELLTSSEWRDLGTQADRAAVKNQFVTLRGFEYSHPIQGHACVWNTSSYTSAFALPTLDLFYRWVDGRGALASFNHPGSPVGTFGLLALSASVVDNLAAIETGNGGDANLGGDLYHWYVQALGQGWKVAPIFAQDNHALGAPSPGRTAVHASALTRADLLDAIRARRVYSTDDPDLRVDFGARRAGDSAAAPMGSIVAPGEVTFEVAVQDDEPITTLQLVTANGAVFAEETLAPATYSASWSVPAVASPGTWVFLRVVVEDVNLEWAGQPKVAVTAPIWFE